MLSCVSTSWELDFLFRVSLLDCTTDLTILMGCIIFTGIAWSGQESSTLQQAMLGINTILPLGPNWAHVHLLQRGSKVEGAKVVANHYEKSLQQIEGIKPLPLQNLLVGGQVDKFHACKVLDLPWLSWHPAFTALLPSTTTEVQFNAGSPHMIKMKKVDKHH